MGVASLAYSEIYVALARLFRRYEMTLTDCDETDVQINCVFLAGTLV